MQEGTVVVIYLVNPKERYWGVLKGISPAGATLTGVDIASFDDWCRQVASKTEGAIGLTTMFFPLPRVEKIIADEASGGGLSLRETFERIAGHALEEALRS